MSRARAAQLNIRSDFVRDRVRTIAAASGKTATQVIEDAVRAYVPPEEEPLPPGLVRRGWMLVWEGDGSVITHEQAEDAILAAREGDDA